MPEKLQIICFKMANSQLGEIDTLIKDQLYFSRSEILRVAIRNLLMKLSLENDYSFSSFTWDGQKSTKDSVSSKLPPVLLQCVDEVVNQGIFNSRSQFIREATRVFLEERNNLHSYIQEAGS